VAIIIKIHLLKKIQVNYFALSKSLISVSSLSSVVGAGTSSGSSSFFLSSALLSLLLPTSHAYQNDLCSEFKKLIEPRAHENTIVVKNQEKITTETQRHREFLNFKARPSNKLAGALSLLRNLNAII